MNSAENIYIAVLYVTFFDLVQMVSLWMYTYGRPPPPPPSTHTHTFGLRLSSFLSLCRNFKLETSWFLVHASSLLHSHSLANQRIHFLSVWTFCITKYNSVEFSYFLMWCTGFFDFFLRMGERITSACVSLFYSDEIYSNDSSILSHV